MRKPTICKHLNDVMEEWSRKYSINSITCKDLDLDHDEIIKTIIDHTFIAGGAIASMVRKEEEDVSDYDIYIDDQSRLKDLTRYYLRIFVKANNVDYDMSVMEDGNGVKIVRDDTKEAIDCLVANQQKNLSDLPFFQNRPANLSKSKFTPIALTPNAITLVGKQGITIQLVTRFSGSPSDVVDSFDFMHTKNYFYQGKLNFDKDALEALITNELIYTGSEFPLCALIRTRKFLERGYRITAGTYLQIAVDLANKDLSSVSTLREQMTGVDVVYFEEVLQRISKENTGGTISPEKVKEIIDSLRDEGLNLN